MIQEKGKRMSNKGEELQFKSMGQIVSKDNSNSMR